MKTVYMLEVGIEDFDENVIFFNTLKQAREYGINYIKKGINNTYYKIYSYDIDDDSYVSNDGNLRYVYDDVFCEWPTESSDIIESKVKVDNEIIDL